MNAPRQPESGRSTGGMTEPSGAMADGADRQVGAIGRTNQYDAFLRDAAQRREQLGLTRTAVDDQRDGVRIDLAGNDYLALSTHPDVVEAGVAALRASGSGAGASRLVTGTHGVHVDLERELADHLGHEAALVFSTGYHANLSVMTTLGTPDTLIVSDAHNHASLIDGMRLAKARVTVTPHLDVAAVRDALAGRAEPRAIIVVESIFSVLGDAAPLRELLDLAIEHDALLVVDEAHGLGVVGERGEGLVSALGLLDGPGGERVVTTVTLSKSLAAQGGAVLGSAALREHLVNTARPFIFDTGLAPAAAGAALGALRHLRAHPERPTRTRDVAAQLARIVGVEPPAGAVLSVPMPSPQDAVAAVAAALQQGLRIGCFRPPSTPDGISRLRLTAHAGIDDADLADIERIMRDVLAAHGARETSSYRQRLTSVPSSAPTAGVTPSTTSSQEIS